MRTKLLALDLDGTLLRDDKTVAEEDASAIAEAQKQGILVTIATGRLVSGTLPTARATGIRMPLVCADGGVVADGATGEVLARTSMDLEEARFAIRSFRRHGAVPFVFTDDEIHVERGSEIHHPFISVWTSALRAHERVEDSSAWGSGHIAMAIGVGHADGVEEAHASVEREVAHTASIRFSLRESAHWAVRVQSKHANKGSGLAAIAARFGVGREEVAVVGDWMNDLPMFAWAGRAFAMGQSPDYVKVAATDRLVHTSRTGGGVAEAIETLLRENTRSASGNAGRT